MNKPIYLDHAASTPLDAKVLERMLPYLTQSFGNPNSQQHFYGRQAAAAVETARQQIAGILNATEQEIYFTSGATESCNLALRGIAGLYHGKPHHIITTQTEHKAVLDTCRALEKTGTKVTYLPVLPSGSIAIDELESAISSQTVLIAISYANNETGVIMPVDEIGKIAKAHNILFFSDATQAVGKIPINVGEANISLLACSSHKLYGPKGVGALYLRRKNPRVSVIPQITGGGQERNIRSGTLNVPSIVGFGAACGIAAEKMPEETARLQQLRDRLEQALLQLPFSILNSTTGNRLPHFSNISFQYLTSNEILASIYAELAVSAGSACTSGSLEPSYVLKAMGREDDIAKSSIRFSIGRFTTTEEIDFTIDFFTKKITELRSQSPAWLLK